MEETLSAMEIALTWEEDEQGAFFLGFAKSRRPFCLCMKILLQSVTSTVIRVLINFDNSNDPMWFGTQIWPVEGDNTEILEDTIGRGRPGSCSSTVIRVLINFDNSNDPNWFGTQTWPVEGDNTEILEDMIGQGRPDSCSCGFPRSMECVRLHANQERDRLKSELGAAFFSWKFDNMGEDVSKSWTFEERRSFKALVRLNPSSMGKIFLKPALKCFSFKSTDEIVSYYFNVFVPGRMRIGTRLSSTVDSDDDEGS